MLPDVYALCSRDKKNRGQISEKTNKQQKKRPWRIFKHQSIGKDYAGDQKMANPKKAQFNQIVTRKCQI